MSHFINAMLSVIIQSAVMLNVVMVSIVILDVVAALKRLRQKDRRNIRKMYRRMD